MKYLALSLFSLTLFLGAARAADTGLEQSVRRVADDFAAAWSKHDVHAMAALWAANGDLITPFGEYAQGAADIEKMLTRLQQGMLKQSAYHLASVEHLRLIAPDVAVVDWMDSVSGLRSPDGTVLPPMSERTFAVLHDSGGKWEFAAMRPQVVPPSPTETSSETQAR